MAVWNSLAPEVQAAIVGAVALILGGSVTAILGLRRYRLERALEVKKEVLLDSVRGAHQATACLSMLTDLTKPVSEVSTLYTSHLAKLVVAGAVANIPTVAAAKDLLNALGPAFVELLVARHPLQCLAGQVEVVERSRELQHADNARYFNMQEEAMASGDSVRLKNIQIMFQSGTRTHNDLVIERNSLINKLDSMRPALAEGMMELQAKVMPLLLEYIACIRLDVGIPGSRKEFIDAAFIDPNVAKHTMSSAFVRLMEPNQIA